MRIHTNFHTSESIRDALRREQAAGRIASHVTFKTLSEHGSRTHDRAYEIQLEAAIRDNGRRAGNSGSYGAMRPEYDGFAATYDEWGWLLSALYRAERAMIVGTAKYPVYRNADDFDRRTGLTYNPWELVKMLDEAARLGNDPTGNGGDPYPIVMGQAAKTKRGYLIGRRGADRHTPTDVRSYWPHMIRPRTVAEVLEFAHLTREDVAVSA